MILRNSTPLTFTLAKVQFFYSLDSLVVSIENFRTPKFTPKVNLRSFNGRLSAKTSFMAVCILPSVALSGRMLEGIEPVEIFHQFLFLTVIQFNNITWRKLFGVIFYRFVYISCFYSIQLSNIPVKNNLSIPDDNDFTFCLPKNRPTFGHSVHSAWAINARPLVCRCP